MTILDEILDHKRREVASARQRIPEREVAGRARAMGEPTRGFRRALVEAEPPRIIAEIKRRSPSQGEIRADFDAAACAKAYADAGAAAISVLTDERYFGGELDFLAQIRALVPLPLLRKDFIVDPYQVDEARAAGADAVLLIVAALDPESLTRLRDHARSLQLDALIEVHDESELEIALCAEADLVGINNRNLRTFEVDLAVTERLASRLPEGVVLVAESGIHTPQDLERLGRSGANAFLVGEALMREADLGSALRRLRGTT